MAKDKERTINPAAAARKAEKDRARKKGKAAVAAQRTERLARQNPSRVERQIADLKEQEQAGSLNARDRKALEDLERDLVRIRKAKEATGGSQSSGVKRRWGEREGGTQPRAPGHGRPNRDESSGEETDESVRRIPMPRDTPPPVPHRRRPGGDGGRDRQRTGNEADGRPAAELPPTIESKTVYEAKPAIKNLQKVAAAYVPSAVRRKIEQSKGTGGKLLEAEEMDALEAQGYSIGGAPTQSGDSESKAVPTRSAHVHMEEVPDESL